jgi:hypothetical protein
VGGSEPGRTPAPFRHCVPPREISAFVVVGENLADIETGACESVWVRFRSYVSKRPQAAGEVFPLAAGHRQLRRHSDGDPRVHLA